MSQLKLELDTADAIVCAALSTALNTIATANGKPAPLERAEPVVRKASPIVTYSEPVEVAAVVKAPTPSASIVEADEVLTTAIEEVQNESTGELDAAGLPWDKRIHSRTKSINPDETYKLMRKPKAFDNNEAWEAYITQCRAEATPATPVTPEVPPAPSAATSVFDEAPSIPPAPSGEVEGVEAPAPVTPPAPVTAPTPTVGDVTFGQLMQLITRNKVDSDAVKAIISNHGVDKIPLLNQRPELIPTVYAEIQAMID